MSGRIVNVRPKPGFLMDGRGEFARAPSNVVSMFSRDRLTNAMSGMGTSVDRRAGLFYAHIPVSEEQAEASYRNSWLWRKIIDIPPFDMTRARRDWQAEGTDIETVEEEERRLQLWPKLQRALILARLYGGGALVLGTTDRDSEQPLDPDRVAKGGLRYIHVMSRRQLSEGQQRQDPEDEWYSHPDFYTINAGARGQVRLHPSRVIAFVGQRAPEGALHHNGSWFWGDPIMQSVGEAVKNADLAQAGFASLIDEAKLDIMKIPNLMGLTATDAGTAQVMARLAAANVGKSAWRALLIDAEEDWTQRQLSLEGMPDTGMFFLQVVAGAADIPVTRLLGVSPKGLQSNGDGEERDYHSMVKARQEELLTPALDRIDPLLIRSALGSHPDDIWHEFAPLSLLSEKDAATVEKQYADAFKVYADTGAIPDDALAKTAVNRMIEGGRWPGLEKAIEESKKDLGTDEDERDEQLLLPRPEQVKLLEKRKTITTEQADALITDAAPRSLYVSRKLLNGGEFIKWAKAQGFETTVPADQLHVTVLFSRAHVDWLKMGSAWNEDEKGNLKVNAGGARLVEKLGDKGAVVLLFNSSALSWRHEEMVRNGASHDFDEYQPHVTITYDGSTIDLSKVEPYRDELLFGPEIFEEVKEDWEKSLTEA